MLQHTSARQGDAWATKTSTPKPPEEVEVLVGFPDQTESDVAPAGYFTRVATKVSKAGDHTSSDVQREVTVHSEVNNCLLHPKSDGGSRCGDQIFHLFTVAGLIAVTNASEHCRMQTGQHVSPDILQSSNMCNMCV